GATFYFMLADRTPFGEGTTAQKLIWHQTRQPKPITQLRKDVPAEMVKVLETMMAKDPNQRYQLPSEIVAALAPWTDGTIPPPARVAPQATRTTRPAPVEDDESIPWERASSDTEDPSAKVDTSAQPEAKPRPAPRRSTVQRRPVPKEGGRSWVMLIVVIVLLL